MICAAIGDPNHTFTKLLRVSAQSGGPGISVTPRLLEQFGLDGAAEQMRARSAVPRSDDMRGSDEASITGICHSRGSGSRGDADSPGSTAQRHAVQASIDSAVAAVLATANANPWRLPHARAATLAAALAAAAAAVEEEMKQNTLIWRAALAVRHRRS